MDADALVAVNHKSPGIRVAVKDTAHRLQSLMRRVAFSPNNDVNEARKLLGFHQGSQVQYRHNSEHSLFARLGEIHPDNRDALIAAAGPDLKTAWEAGRIAATDRLPPHLRDTQVAVGGANADTLTRIALGYIRDPENSGGMILSRPPLNLPFWIDYNSELALSGATAGRIVAGRGLVRRPPWRVVSDSDLFIPQLDSSGMLSTDYLLITKTRNYLTADAFDSGSCLILIAGPHGTGTKALSLLYRFRAGLTAIHEATEGRGDVSFQALFRVGDIDHRPASGSTATKIELVAVERLPDDPLGWSAARKAVRPQVTAWIASQG